MIKQIYNFLINFIELKVNLKYTAVSQVDTRFSTLPKLMKPSLLQWVLRDQGFCNPISDKLQIFHVNKHWKHFQLSRFIFSILRRIYSVLYWFPQHHIEDLLEYISEHTFDRAMHSYIHDIVPQYTKEIENNINKQAYILQFLSGTRRSQNQIKCLILF